MAAELPFAQRTIFNTKKIPNRTLKIMIDFVDINYLNLTQDMQQLSLKHFSSIVRHQTL
jgi:hypothetical protein